MLRIPRLNNNKSTHPHIFMWVIILLKKFSVFLALLILFPVTVKADDISAQSAVVMDAYTGTILYEKNAYEPKPMASTTKIMTALLAVESGRLGETVNITDDMLRTEGSCMGLRDGDTMTLKELVIGMMLTSGNDSANAVAYILSGGVSEFSSLMNKRAKQLGMKDTCFVTPSGLDEGNHHSTAYDMALLTAEAVKNEEFCDIVSRKSADLVIGGKKTTVYNHNKLLSDDDYFGVKTGYTKKAGRCLVSAKKYKNNKIICVTLNAPDDWNDHKKLASECEKKYNDYQVSDAFDIDIVGAAVDKIRVGYSSEYAVLSDLEFKIYYKPFCYAPVKAGEKLGCVKVYINGTLIDELPLRAEKEVKYYAAGQQNKTAKIYG